MPVGAFSSRTPRAESYRGGAGALDPGGGLTARFDDGDRRVTGVRIDRGCEDTVGRDDDPVGGDEVDRVGTDGMARA